MIVRIKDIDKYLKEHGFEKGAVCPNCGLSSRVIFLNSHLQYDDRLNEYVILFEGNKAETMCYECGFIRTY